MANSVGSVTIDLEARIAKFESDLGRAARVAEQRSNEMRRTLGAIAGVLGAGISIAGITSFVRSALDAQDAISKLSQKVGVSTEALSGWELAAKQAGVENEAFEKGLVKLAQSSTMAVQGSKMQADAFKSIGVSVSDASGHLKSMDQLFPQVIDKLEKYKDGTAKTAIATQIFGRAGADLIPLINAGSKGLSEYIKLAEDFGLVVGSKSAKAAEDFNDHLEQLSFVSKGVANQLATSLAPALADLATKAVGFFRSNEWKQTLKDIGDGAKYVADHIGDIIIATKLLGEIVVTVYSLKLLKLGSEWIGNLTAQGVAVDALGAKTALSLGGTIKNIGLLKTSLNLVGAAVVGWQIGSYLYDQFQIVRDAGAVMVGTLLVGWEKIKEGARLAFLAIEDTWIEAVQRMQKVFGGFAEGTTNFLKSSSIPAFKLAGEAMGVALANGIGTGSEKTEAQLTKNAIERMKVRGEAEKKIAEIQKNTWSGIGAASDSPAADKTLEGFKKTGAALDVVSDTASKAAAALEKYRQAQDALSAKAADAVSSYIGKEATPDVKAWNDYADVVRKVAEAEGQRIQTAIDAQKAGLKGVDVAKVEADAQRDTASAIDQLTEARDKNIAAAQKQMDFGQTMADQAVREASIATLSQRDQQIARANIEATNKALEQHRALTDADVQAQIRLAEQGAATAYDLQKQAEQQNALTQEYAGYWENAASSIAKSFGDLFTGQTKSFKAFGQSLKSIAQQFVSDMISTFLRMRVIGPILSGALGYLGGSGSSGASVLGLVSQYYGNGSVVSGSASSIGGASGGGAAGGGYGGFASNIQTAKSAYDYLFGGGTQYAAVNGTTTAQTAIGTSAYNTTTPYYGGSTSASLGGVPYASIGGGLIGAYYGSKQGAGGFSTAASTVSYGALGAGVAGTAAGVAGGASLGSAATGAFGAAAASTSWVPIVGWIIAAAALVDHFSGGKVFGTKYATGGANLNLGIGPDGSSASANLDQWKYHSGVVPNFMGALTGGWSEAAKFGDKDRRNVQQPVTPEMLAAAKLLYDNIEKTLVKGAQKLSVDVPEMLSASIEARTTYDKKGKSQGTKYIVDYLDRTWEEATAEAASQRLGAEALVKVVQASAGDVAQTIAEQWRDSADTLLDGAETMLAAQADINKGNDLVALGASASLAQVVQFTETMQQDGEKLADTYQRLVQASAAYLQFVGQFAPAATGFGASLEAIAKQMQSNIDQANTLAQAAGLQGAKESDLANIHQSAAQQAADAIATLTASASDLAAKLYGGTADSLTAVNALLDKMSGKVQTATQLAIGDNSPLNDKEKLDVALKGLRSGITSADDVLGLGRKLYASSADYAGLYAKVQDILQLPGAGTTGTAGISSSLDEYNKLIGQRDQYQSQADATARFGDAKTLAQYVADISTTHGIGYGEAASGLGFSLSDLSKDLGVTNLTGYLDNLKLAEIPSSTMDASASIVDAIQELGRDLIATITGGPVTNAGVTSGKTAAPSDPQVIALLKQLNDALAQNNQHAAITAGTNTDMAKQGKQDQLNQLAGSSRNGKTIAVAQ